MDNESTQVSSSRPSIAGFDSVWIDQRGSEVLERNECERLLALASLHGGLGRVAIPTHTSPIIVPLNFRYVDRHVLVRVGPGIIATACPGSLVAFEVDRVEPEAGRAWSVLVRGLASSLPEHNMHRLWHQLPEPLVPLPGDLLLSIRGDVLTGRRFRLVAGPQGECPTPVVSSGSRSQSQRRRR